METATDYRTERELILMLVDIVSRGGNLLLDIGPTADGRIPVIMQERLLQMGAWLKVNGDAIYGSAPWSQTRLWGPGAVPEIKETQYAGEYDIAQMVDSPPAGAARIEAFFTVKNGDLYMMVPRWPRQPLAIPNLSLRPDARVTLLATGQSIPWRVEGSGIRLSPPPAAPDVSAPVYVFRVSGLR
jgi:alpha-L-fucosidase